MDKVLKHQNGKSQKMKDRESLGKALVITCQVPETSQPAETPFNDPATGKQNKASFGFGQSDHNQIDPLCLSGLFGSLTRITLVHESHFDAVTGDHLNVLRQLRDLVSVLFIGAGHMQSQQIV